MQLFWHRYHYTFLLNASHERRKARICRQAGQRHLRYVHRAGSGHNNRNRRQYWDHWGRLWLRWAKAAAVRAAGHAGGLCVLHPALEAWCAKALETKVSHAKEDKGSSGHCRWKRFNEGGCRARRRKVREKAERPWRKREADQYQSRRAT